MTEARQALSFKRTDFVEESVSAPAKRLPSLQQQAAIDWVSLDRGNVLITAVAGSGKTTTLEMMLAKMGGYVSIVCFNKPVQLEIEARVRKAGYDNRVQVGTFHSFGFRMWRKIAPGVKIEGLDEKSAGYYKIDRIFNIMDGLEQFQDVSPMPVPVEYRKFVKKLMGLAKQYAIGTSNKYRADDLSLWQELVDHFDLDQELIIGDPRFNHVTEDMVDRGIAYAREALTISYKLAWEVIDFDDMVYMPLFSNFRVFQVNWLLVDECHPPGTPILTALGGYGPNTKVGSDPIESIRVGDQVVSYSRENGLILKRGQCVTRVNNRHFDGELITVNTENGSCRYTPEHKCWVHFRNLQTGYFVYLMGDGNGRFRIGQCAARIGHRPFRFGPKFRLDEQGGTMLWLLKWFPDRIQALSYEQEVSAKFGIPTTLFKPGHKSTPEKEDRYQSHLDFFWNNLSSAYRVDQCLVHHGRLFDFPFIQKNGEYDNTNWLSRPFVVRACNLMTGCTMASYNGTNKVTYTDAVVGREHYVGPVYSIDVEHDHMYIAGDLVTHNCQDLNRSRRLLAQKMVHPFNGRGVFVGDDRQAIYGYAGADSESFARIREEFRCKDLHLTYTFRCPKKVVELAKTWVNHIEATPDAKEGTVLRVSLEEFAKMELRDTDAILCRNNAPLIMMAFSLIRRGIGCYVEGRDIGKNIMDLATKWSVSRLSVLRDRAEAYKAREVAKLLKRGHEAQADLLADRVDTLLALIDGMPKEATVNDLQVRISTMFKNREDVRGQLLVLSSVHKAKGKEWERVILLGRNTLMPSAYAKKEWHLVQEANLCYVAVTRATDTFIDVDMPRTGIPKSFFDKKVTNAQA